MSHFGNRIACSFPRNLDLQSNVHRTVVHDVQCLCIREQAQDVVQMCAASRVVNASCLISTSCVLAVPTNSPSLGAIAAQYALISNNYAVYGSLLYCSPEYTFGFVKSFVSTRLKPARTSVCAVAVRCLVNSCATASSCAACTLPGLATVESPLLLP